ncbi:MAG: C25 family cysteine peptidase [Cyclobacteriaceae bacterium]|nr:C25 family cysteine peptidase [Cyclobacteriaceae bacterium]
MNRLIVTILMAVIGFNTFSQPYGNEWVDFNKNYYKVKIGSDGIYRLTYANLASVGFPVDEDNKRIQLFNRGQEMAVFVNDTNGDNIFNASDYVEFYGKANDGTLDSELYVPSSTQPHTYYNLYSDTTAYYLTSNIVNTGKRMQTSNEFVGGVNESYHLDNNLTLFTNEYSQGLTQVTYNSLTSFGVGEGFTGDRITENTNPTKDFLITNISQTVTSAPVPTLKILLVGLNEQSHAITIQVGSNTPEPYNFTGFNNLLIEENINWSDVSGSGELVVRVNVTNNGGSNSNISVSYINLAYAQDFNMNGALSKKYNLRIKGAGGNDVSITNVPANANVYDITDATNVVRVNDANADPTIIECSFLDASVERILWVNETNSTEPVIEAVSFRQMSMSANYIIISHSSLMQPAGGFPDAVRAYAGYRSTATGGAFDTLVVDIQQLYDQFSYGEITPLAIYRFMEFLVVNGNPQNLFLIGKSLVVSHNFYRRPKSDFTFYDLVPTAGVPGADAPFTAGLAGTTYESAVPTGRLGASKPMDVINYLNKVIEHEVTPFNDLWRKHLLNLSGGNSESELATFRGYVDGYANIAKGFYFGADATTQSKTTSAPVEFINVSSEVNSGVNQITFFGHSAPNVTDIDIGFVSDPANGYNNKGKYPLVVMNGCNAGNIYNDDYIFGEDWILTPNLGSTAVIAHTSFGFSSILNIWSNLFFSLGYGDLNYMDKSLGVISNEVGKQMAAISTSPFFITQIQQMGLHGDPAIKLFGTQVPDYELSNANVQPIELINEGITAEADSFALALGVRNFAAYLNDSLDVFVRRTLQNGAIIDYDTVTFKPVRHRDTLIYVLDNKYEGNFGTNSFEIVLDPANKLTELDKFNNRVFFNYFIPISGTVNLTPPNYGIVSTIPFSLKSQISSQPSENRNVNFELDTISSSTSQSPVYSFNMAGGTLVTEWNNISILPDLPMYDSLAYYWKTIYTDLKPGESSSKTESTFTYIKDGDEGWAQVAYHQMKKNPLTGLALDEGNREIKFDEVKLDFMVKTFGVNTPGLTYRDVELLIDGQSFILGTGFQSCSNNRLAIIAFDDANGTPYAPIFGGQVNAWTCGRSPQIINIVNEGAGSGRTLDEVLDAVNYNDFVLVFTIGSFDFNLLTASAITKLEDLGADPAVLGAKTANEPYIMYGKKGLGAGNSIAELLSDPGSLIPTDEQIITYTGQSIGIKGNGVMKSVLIGPAILWDKLEFETDVLGINDEISVDIIGKDFSGNETILSTGIQQRETSLNWIDPINYPYISLQYNVLDTVNKTAVQLKKWIVNYTLAPEGVLSFVGNDAGNQLQVELQEGDSIYSEFAFINITNKAFNGKLPVEYNVFNSTLRTTISNTLLIDPPAPNDTIKFKIPIGTKGLIGVNNLSIFVNNFSQAEQVYVNNNISLPNYITIIKDETNPLLDISFDGRYIYDGEIVSASPTVLIKILESNPLLLKTDTVGINIFLTPPCDGCGKIRVPLTGNEINYTVASKDKPFEINYQPMKLENGMYELSVQVEDASGNLAGVEPYIVNFEVINESTVTNFYPYPNPFSTSVRFVFTLTGTEIPDGIMIRIMTVTGRVVRTITQDEIGPVHIGNNLSDYAWDGRDEFGDQLANGVYLYKVTLEINGDKVDFRSSAGDRGFKNGYGKMYLLR